MNHVIQEWKLKNLEIVEEKVIRTRITRLLDDADKLGKFTRDMKKTEFIVKYQKETIDYVQKRVAGSCNEHAQWD